MKRLWILVVVASILPLAGCAKKESEDSPSSTSSNNDSQSPNADSEAGPSGHDENMPEGDIVASNDGHGESPANEFSPSEEAYAGESSPSEEGHASEPSEEGNPDEEYKIPSAPIVKAPNDNGHQESPAPDTPAEAHVEGEKPREGVRPESKPDGHSEGARPKLEPRGDRPEGHSEGERPSEEPRAEGDRPKGRSEEGGPKEGERPQEGGIPMPGTEGGIPMPGTEGEIPMPGTEVPVEGEAGGAGEGAGENGGGAVRKPTDIPGVKENTPEYAAVDLILKVAQGQLEGLSDVIAENPSGEFLKELRVAKSVEDLAEAKEGIGQVQPVNSRLGDRGETIVTFRNNKEKVLQFYVKRVQGNYQVRELRVREAARTTQPRRGRN